MKTVNIVGYGKTGLVEPGEVWGMNDLWRHRDEDWTRWFDLHDPAAMYAGALPRSPNDSEQMAWLRTCPYALYMFPQYAPLFMAESFPSEALLLEFGPVFANTFAWLIGLALHEGFERIVLVGDEHSSWFEKAWERPSVAYMVGLAFGVGVDVAGAYWLWQDHLYGLEQAGDPRWQVRRRLAKRWPKIWRDASLFRLI